MAKILFTLPLFVRRIRQSGMPNYGMAAILLALGCWLLDSYGEFTGNRELTENFFINYLPSLLLPFYFIGGDYAGRKTDMMRAAIAGDKERVREEIALHPRRVLRKGERGYTAREYAEMRGFRVIADILRRAEERAKAE